MNPGLASRLGALKADYLEVTGGEFLHFFCPILYEDQDVRIGKGHVINSSIPNAPTRWIPQRRDVDNFFGSNFESEFVDLQQYKYSADVTPYEVLVDEGLSKRFRPRITLDGERIEHFRATGQVPQEFSKVEFAVNERSVNLGLKVSPDRLLGVTASRLDVEIRMDVRLAALVTLLKAAHLSLFELLGYRYIFSAGGHFLGNTILGDFFRENQGRRKPAIRQAALAHFREFSALVRPMIVRNFEFQGTISDNRLFLCVEGRGLPWALMVLVKTGRTLHAVLVPSFEAPGLIERFFSFLHDDNETIHAHHCEYVNQSWRAAPEPRLLTWPKSGAAFS